MLAVNTPSPLAVATARGIVNRNKLIRLVRWDILIFFSCDRIGKWHSWQSKLQQQRIDLAVVGLMILPFLQGAQCWFFCLQATKHKWPAVHWRFGRWDGDTGLKAASHMKVQLQTDLLITTCQAIKQRTDSPWYFGSYTLKFCQQHALRVKGFFIMESSFECSPFNVAWRGFWVSWAQAVEVTSSWGPHWSTASTWGGMKTSRSAKQELD